MFTGLVENLGIIKEIGIKDGSTIISIETKMDLSESKIGDSISISGMCLTIVDIERNIFTFEASPETISRTILKELKNGDKVNLERAMRINDRLGGHLVTGHIDGMGTIQNKTKAGNSIKIEIVVSGDTFKYIVEKGSVTIDGISLTVNDCQRNVIIINVIPHTAQHTTLRFKKAGDKVNVETDIIGKYVEKLLYKNNIVQDGNYKKIDYKFLEESGFI